MNVIRLQQHGVTARYLEWHLDGDPICSGIGHAPRQPDNTPSWPMLAERAEHTQPKPPDANDGPSSNTMPYIFCMISFR